MTPTQLKAWRLHMGKTQTEAATLLEISESWYGQLEKGHKRGTNDPVTIPTNIARACGWLAHFGDKPYHGPE